MEQLSAGSSVLDLDLSDIDDSDSHPKSALINRHLAVGGGGTTTQMMKDSPPKTPRNTIQMFSNTLPGRGKELLSEAGLGVNRVVAMTPTVPQNQYWMLPGAVYDD